MKAGVVLNSVLSKFGVRLVRTSTFENIARELVELRKSRPFLENIYGHRLYVNHEDAGLRYGPLVGVPVEQTEDKYFAQNISSGQSVLDLGANVGSYSLLFAKLVGPEGRVISFEPGPKSFDLLKQNIAANGYTNIEAVNAAVSDRNGDAELFVCPTGESDNRLEGVLDRSSGWPSVTVRCYTVDDYLQDQRIDMVKIDIQGSEFAALRGMRRTIELNKAIKIALEFSPELIGDTSAFFAFTRDLGLSVFDMNDHALAPAKLLSTTGGEGQPKHRNIVLRR